MALIFSELDVLIALPLLPLAPIVATWWLPWERWIPWGRVPKALAGPYLLYVSFALQHFRLGSFLVTTSLLAGAVLSVWGAVDVIRNWRYWPLGRKGPWAGIADRDTLVYWESWRKMTIAGRALADGFEIHVASIATWDDSDGELVLEAERRRILRNVQSSLQSQGVRAVLN